MAWRYRLTDPAEIAAPELAGISYAGEWLSIGDGRARLRAGYAWDGCSPAVRVTSDIWLGPPDGPLREDGRPAAWSASLWHDALCQFRGEIQGLTKRASVALFARLLNQSGAPRIMRTLYPIAVAQFGPQDWPNRL